jgi:signal transduction histidine kinase
MLRDFIATNREEILARARLRVAERKEPPMSGEEMTHGLPLFLDQLHMALHRASRHEGSDHSDLKVSAAQHGDHLFQQGLTVGQVINGYGDLCQVITGIAMDQRAPIDADEFQTLNLCLDDATANAVTAFARRRESAISSEGTERLGVLAHEMRNLLNTAILTFGSIQKGTVSASGNTGLVHARSLLQLNILIDRSLADVRLDASVQNVARLVVREVFEEVGIGASMIARTRGIHFDVTPVDAAVIVAADRQILIAAIANLVHNAFKFTATGRNVSLRAVTTTSRVLIEIEDECGGLPPGGAEELLRPFIQKGGNRTGLGLGLSICVKAVKAMQGELKIRDLPGQGCIFTIDLPKEPPPPTSIFAGHRKDGDSGESNPGAVMRDARAES